MCTNCSDIDRFSSWEADREYEKEKEMEELNQTIDQMLEIKDLIAQHKFELKRLEQQEELLNVKLIGVLKKSGVNEMVLPNCYFGLKTGTRTAFDQKLFKEQNPEMFNKYYLTKETEKFEFKIGNKN